ncbi:hypothetical protein LCGC14_1398320 [marine sediment metagenome]|uniref:Uncharacterized protein n=1 Tax=marine sediment metagenome TaxID=412755 RepID=A0A0F9MZE7_9ZZZZ
MTRLGDNWHDTDWLKWGELFKRLANATGISFKVVTTAVGTDDDCHDAIETQLYDVEGEEFEGYRLSVSLDEFKRRLQAVDARERLERVK